MSFRLVPKSVTLNDLKRRSPNRTIISSNSDGLPLRIKVVQRHTKRQYDLKSQLQRNNWRRFLTNNRHADPFHRYRNMTAVSNEKYNVNL